MVEASRRHLTHREAESALGRGKPVEIFLGSCGELDRPGLRFAQLNRDTRGVQLWVHETISPGADFLDLYEAAPLGDNTEGVVLEDRFPDLSSALAALETKFPAQNYAMVNFGVLGDEYLDFLKGEFRA